MNRQHATSGRIIRVAFATLTLFLLAGAAFPVVGGEPRRFTDEQGRQITAEIVAVKEDTVSLLRGDRTFEFPIAKLSPDDRDHIRKWAQLHADAASSEVKIECRKKRTEREKIKGAGTDVTREDWIFEVEIENGSPAALEALELRCRIYHWDAQVPGERKDKKITESRIEIAELPGKGARTELVTEPVGIFETNLAGSFADGSSSKKKDELEGAWVRLYQGEKMLAEFRDDTPVLKKETWPEEEKK